jgi:uncharacterized protein (UPF0332 family)
VGIDRLVREGSIQSFQASAAEINKALLIADRDLATAFSIKKENPDWAYNIAYNAVLQACKAYMFSQGYRPSSAENHKSTLAFILETLPEPWHTRADYFDRVRKKRHKLVYDEIGLASRNELDNLLIEAPIFVDFLKNEIKKAGG